MRKTKRYHGHCLGCKDRKVGCHSTCEYYIADKKAYEEELEMIKTNEIKETSWKRYLAEKKKRTFK